MRDAMRRGSSYQLISLSQLHRVIDDLAIAGLDLDFGHIVGDDCRGDELKIANEFPGMLAIVVNDMVIGVSLPLASTMLNALIVHFEGV